VSNPKHVATTSPLENIDALEHLLDATTESTASYLEDAHPADAVTVLRRLSHKRAAEVAAHLNPQTTALLLRESDESAADQYPNAS